MAKELETVTYNEMMQWPYACTCGYTAGVASHMIEHATAHHKAYRLAGGNATLNKLRRLAVEEQNYPPREEE